MHFTASARKGDIIIVEDDGYEDKENLPHTKWNELLQKSDSYKLRHCNYDSSTIMSESIGESSSDFENNDFNLNAEPTVQEKESSVHVSVQHSTDVLFGNKTLITGPVVIKNFIAASDTLNGNQKDKRSDWQDTSEIINTDNNKETPPAVKSLHCIQIFFRHRPVTIVTVVAGIFIVTLAALGGYYLNLSIDEPALYDFVSRDDYNALPRRGVLLPLNLPVKYVIIGATEGANCTDLEECKEVARHVQWYHMDINGWDEVGLNFMIGGDGRVYEGSGYEEGAHDVGYNFDSVCISFIGTFTEYAPAEQQFITTQRLIDDGVKRNKIHSQYVLYAQRQLRGGDSPGKYVYDKIISWPNYSKDVIPNT